MPRLFQAARALTHVLRMLRGLRRLCEQGAVRFTLFASYALAVTWPLFDQAGLPSGLANQFRDAQLLGTYERDAVHAVRAFHVWPFWDPYLCGGVYALGSPQGRLASPPYLLSLVFGADRAEPLIAFAMILLGLEGTFRWARRQGAGKAGALLAAPLFAASGTFAALPFLGWTNFYGFELLPWVLLGWQDALAGRLRGALLAAAAWCWMIGFGGTYAAPMTALVCGLLGLKEALACRTLARARVLAGAALLTMLFSAGLGAVRLWPLLETLVAAPRTLGGHPGRSLVDLGRALTTAIRIKAGNVAGADMYTLGRWFMAPALLAGLLLRPRRALALALFAVLALWTATGYAAVWSPFIALRTLPLFSSLRYPERYLIFVALAAAGVAALGVDHLRARARHAALSQTTRASLSRIVWNGLAVATMVLLAANASYLASNHHLVAQKRWLGPLASSATRPFRQSRGNRWTLATFPAMERGSLQCWDAYPVPMSPALRADLPAEEQWVSDSAGTATRMSWAPDRIAVRVHAPKEGVLRVNQNFHPGWRADRGRVFSDDGLLALALPAGDHVVHLRFLPRSGFGGLAVSVTTLVAMVALTLLSRRRGGPTTVLARPAWIALLGPLGVLTLVLVFVREPAPRRPVPTSPSGAPLLAAPPAAAAAIAAGHPIAIDPSHALDLAGAEAAPADKALGEGLLRVTLWWRRTGALVKTPWRVRVILRNDEGLLLQQNHELVSSWLPLHKLPLDTYVRDEIFFPLPPAEKSPSATSPAELLLELEDAQGATISAGREPLLTGVPLP